ncbi:MAG: biotin--[Butyrivibrio sp.]|nr:biotin--[acetyl-CoA-carboxylase] ligase [Butyrivibrio sp.]
MLSYENIQGQLHTRWAACNLVYKEETGSTNDDAKALAAEGAPHGTLVVADRQTSGRGTRGRTWETQEGSNVAMSLVIRPTISADKLPVITLIMGLSVAQGLEDILIENMEIADFPQIKWPNDVIIAGKKICGILTELHMNNDNTVSDVVVGVGININMTVFPDDIKNIAGSVYSQTGFKIDRGRVVASVMKRFEDNYDLYMQTLDLSLLKKEYEERLINTDKTVRVLDPAGEYEAIARGITTSGALIIEKEDGTAAEVNAGEVSVRGLYGYV